MYSNKFLTIAFFLFLPALLFSQVYTTTSIVAGSGYSAAPTITASGGSCSSEPTLVATVNGGGLASVLVTYAGQGCTSAPSLAFSGAGTGAAATAVLLPSSIVLLSTVPSVSASALLPNLGGSYYAWVYACWLTVPASRTQFYSANLYALPGTAQTSAYANAPAGLAAALTSGVITEYDDKQFLPSTSTTATVEAAISTACSVQQTNLNSWNPWAHYGSTYLNGTWTVVTIP